MSSSLEVQIGQENYNILSLSLDIPIRGCWDIDQLRISEEVSSTVGDSVTIKLFDKELKGTIVDIVPFAGITTLIISAGSYKLGDILESDNFYGGIVRDVVNFVLSKTNMSLSTKSSLDILSTSFNRFDKIKASSADILDRLLELTDGGIWRVELDGSLYIGREEYPDISVKYPEATENDNYLVRDKEMTNYDIYTMDILFEPGFTIDSKKVRKTTITVDSETTTTILSFLPPEYISTRNMASNMKEIVYTTKYSVSVLEQTANGNVSVIPDSEIQDLFGGGLKNVPIVYPMPNMQVKVKPGAKCILEFLNGSPTNPIISGWLYNNKDLVTVYFSDVTTDTSVMKGAARINDPVNVGTLSGIITIGMTNIPVTFTYAPANGGPSQTLPLISISGGVISNGSQTVKIGD